MNTPTGITISALYARIDRLGAVVCTATLRPLGTVKWVTVGHNVTWRFTVAGTDETGVRTTQRAAVQALRDAANKRAQHPLPLGPDDEQPIAERAAARIARARAQRDEQPDDEQPDEQSAPAAAPAQRIAPTSRVTWGTATDVADLTSAIQRSFDRHKGVK